MAQATTVKFGQQYILIGNGATPTEVFEMPCGITSLTRQITTNTADVDIPDCEDPDALVWLGIDVNSKRMTLTFGGILAEEAIEVWDEWAMEEATKNVRWYRNLAAPNAGYFMAPAVLTEYQEQAENRGRYQISGTIIFDGKPIWTAVP
jgi:hypothetical protein